MTGPGRYDDCRLYLRGMSRNAAVELAARATGASCEAGFPSINGIGIEILRNPGFTHDASDFPAWPIKIEVDNWHAAAHQAVAAVSKILTSAGQTGHDAVAACDYEDELPEQGGYPRYRN